MCRSCWKPTRHTCPSLICKVFGVKYVLGIDQGGSKTHALLADESGALLGIGTGPGAIHSSHGMTFAMNAVLAAVNQACAAAGVSPVAAARVYGGLTGVDWPEEGPLLQKALAGALGVPAERVTVVNDCMIALRAATDNRSACILCAGSGLNCGVRKENEEYVFGYYIEDNNQGGAALGRRVLQAVFDSESGLLPPTQLTEAVLTYMDCPSPDELLRRQVEKRLDGGRVLHLPEVLEQTALAGDPVAAEVLRRFALDIAQYPVAALKRFCLTHGPVDVVLSGSVFKCRARVLQETVITEILAEAPGARITESRYEPVVGAVLGALDELNAGHTVIEQIDRDAHRLNLIRTPEEE